ncbi:hypothetical protein GY45DRAFT_1299392 [Cubamyces sp. BRFM 1775]|nr:hypothetical protein GY45DRAFT_1299392 [Cubamyces sp. BRFM 1775]
MPPRKKARTDASAVPTPSGRITRSRAKALEEQGDAAGTRKHEDSKQPEIQQQAQTPVEVRIKPYDRTLPLSAIEDMPLDVLIEIFSRLHPRDLLSLARTSKAFRSFLMNRRSTRVWQAARQAVSERIPQCPYELSEPKYAVLLFTSECMHCGQLGVEKAYWKILARYCCACEATEVVSRETIAGLLSSIEDETQARDGPVLTIIREAWCPWSGLLEYYHRPEVAHLQLLLRVLKRHKLTKRQVIEDAMAAVEKRAKFVQVLEGWAVQEELRKKQEIIHLRNARASQAKERLVQLGWAEELTKLSKERSDMFRALKPLYKVDTLTNEEWQTIQGEMVTFMEETRALRIKAEWKALLQRRLRIWERIVRSYEDSLGCRDPTSDLRAMFSDLALVPAVRDLILVPDIDDADLEVELLKLRGTIPQMQADWYRKCEQQLSSLVGANETAAAERAGISPASMAVVTFTCSKRDCGREGLRWPDILAHRCGRRVSYPSTCGDRAYQEAVVALCSRRENPWQHSPHFTVRIVSKVPQDRIRLSGRDPYRMSYTDVRGVRFYCAICAVPAVGYMEVYDWETADYHGRPRCGHGRWAVLDPENTAVAIAYERSNRMAGNIPDAIFGCTHCRYRSEKHPSRHCETAHKIVKPEINKDFYLHPDTPQAGKLPVLMYPEYARTDRTAARDVKAGKAVFSPHLYCD